MFRRLDRLAIDEPSAGLAPFAGGHPHIASEQIMHAWPSPVPTPLPTIVIHEAPWGQIMGEHPPRSSTARPIEDGIQNLTLRIRFGAPARFGFGHQMVDHVPFFIGQVGRICLSGRHALQDNRSRPAQINFLDTLLEDI